MIEYKVKFVMLGNENAGKSSISNLFIYGDPKATQGNTIGATFLSKTLYLDQCNLCVHLWDTAGQERYRCITPIYYRGSHVFTIVFDVNDYSSWEGMKYWYNKIISDETLDKYIINVIGNKIDKDFNISIEEIKLFERHTGIEIDYVSTCVQDAFSKINHIFERSGKILYETILSQTKEDKENVITLLDIKPTSMEKIRYNMYRVKSLCGMPKFKLFKNI